MTDEAPPSSLRRLVLIALMCVVLGGLGGLGAASFDSGSEADAVPVRFVPPREPAFDFRLRDQDGRRASLASARGEVVVLTFLYTACWDLCPAQAAEVAEAVDRVGPGVVVYVVSVDPVGDTPEHVHEWIEEHGFEEMPLRYLMGSRRRLAAVWRAYGIVPLANTKAYAQYEAFEAAQGEEEEEEEERSEEPQPYSPPRRRPPNAAMEPYPDADDLRYRGRPRHAAGDAFEHSAYVLLIDKHGEQRVGFPFEQLDPDVLEQDIRLLRNER
jgi:cytochrome oxidase Cu insertion factor (SCO1/SenC/PrrC family)